MLSSFHSLAERANYSTPAAIGFIGFMLGIAILGTAILAVVAFGVSSLMGFSFATAMVVLWAAVIVGSVGVISWSARK